MKIMDALHLEGCNVASKLSKALNYLRHISYTIAQCRQFSLRGFSKTKYFSNLF